jgi:type VI protein secretion system component VasF
MACRKDLDVLISSLNKAINSISENKKKEIAEKWVSLEVPVSFYQKMIQILFPIAALLIVVLAFLFIKGRLKLS